MHARQLLEETLTGKEVDEEGTSYRYLIYREKVANRIFIKPYLRTGRALKLIMKVSVLHS